MNLKFMTAVVIVACATPLLADTWTGFTLTVEGNNTVVAYEVGNLTVGNGLQIPELNRVILVMDGEEVGYINTTDSSNNGIWVTFDNLDDDDVFIEDGDTICFAIEADISEAYEGATGNTIQVITPEPATILLLGLAAPILLRRKRR